MTITADWQIELPDRSLLIGAGTSYDLRVAGGLGGVLDQPKLRTDDLQRTGANGSSLGRVRADWRSLGWRVGVDGATSAAVTALVQTLLVKWRAPEDGAEVAADVRVPGSPETVMRYYGQPRSAVADVGAWGNGRSTVEVDCEFFASDPFGYGAEVADDGNTGTFAIAAAGLGDLGADTDRVLLTFTGSGGTPSLTNNTTGGVITFAAVLANTIVATVDLRTGAVIIDGTPTPNGVTAGSTWFALRGGVENSLTLAGATDVDVDYRPAFW